MKQEATTTAWTSCRCSDKVLRRQFKEQECHTEETSVNLIIHISLRHISEIITCVFICIESSIPLLVFLPFLLHLWLSRPLCVEWRQQAWGGGFRWNAGSCSGSRPVCTPVISPVWSLCFPREASGLPPTPCPLSKTHTCTHTEMYTEHKFMWVQCTGWQPKSALNQGIWTL